MSPAIQPTIAPLLRTKVVVLHTSYAVDTIERQPHRDSKYRHLGTRPGLRWSYGVRVCGGLCGAVRYSVQCVRCSAADLAGTGLIRGPVETDHGDHASHDTLP